MYELLFFFDKIGDAIKIIFVHKCLFFIFNLKDDIYGYPLIPTYTYKPTKYPLSEYSHKYG